MTVYYIIRNETICLNVVNCPLCVSVCNTLQSVDTVDEARRLREVSEKLRDRAISTATKIEEGPHIATDLLSSLSLLSLICCHPVFQQ